MDKIKLLASHLMNIKNSQGKVILSRDNMLAVGSVKGMVNYINELIESTPIEEVELINHLKGLIKEIETSINVGLELPIILEHSDFDNLSITYVDYKLTEKAQVWILFHFITKGYAYLAEELNCTIIDVHNYTNQLYLNKVDYNEDKNILITNNSIHNFYYIDGFNPMIYDEEEFLKVISGEVEQRMSEPKKVIEISKKVLSSIYDKLLKARTLNHLVTLCLIEIYQK